MAALEAAKGAAQVGARGKIFGRWRPIQISAFVDR
jgi:hypothetical protein